MITESEIIYEIPCVDIHVDYSWNSREIQNIDYAELKRAIRGDGQQQPGIVVLANPDEKIQFGKTYILVAGFRRFFVVNDLGIKVYKAVIREAATNEERLKLNFSENFGRQQLTFYETARFLQKRVAEGWTEEKIMKAFQMSRSYVQPRVQFLKLMAKHPALEELARADKITQDNVRRLNSITDFNDRESQIKELKEAAEMGLTFKVKKHGVKTKRDQNTMLFERNKSMRTALVQWAFGVKVPYKRWYKIISWINGTLDNNALLDFFDEENKDISNTEEFKDLIDDLESYADNTDRLYFKLAKLKQDCSERTYERPVNGFPEK